MPTLDDKYLHAFGYLISTFARVEKGFLYFLEQVTGLDFYQLSILTTPYSAVDWENVLTAFLDQEDVAPEDSGEMREVLKVWVGCRALRNKIAHELWTPGEAEGAIKPIGMRNRGSVKLYGHEDNEVELSYEQLAETCKQLDEAQRKLATLSKRWRNFIPE